MKMRIDTETAERLELVRKDQGLPDLESALTLVCELATKKLWPERLQEIADQAADAAAKARARAAKDAGFGPAADEAERVAKVRQEQANAAKPPSKK